MFKTKVILGKPQDGFSVDFFSDLFPIPYLPALFLWFNNIIIQKLMKPKKFRFFMFVLFILAIIFLIFSLSLKLLNNDLGYYALLSWSYMCFTFMFMVPSLYFRETSFANRLRHALNLTIRYEKYRKKSSAEPGKEVAFEWEPSTLIILGALINNGPQAWSFQDCADLLGIQRPSAVSLLSKLEKCGIIKKSDDGVYHYDGVEIEVWEYDSKKKDIVLDVKKTNAARKRLLFLFDLLCFEAYSLYGEPYNDVRCTK